MKSAVTALPEPIGRLRELAHNLWWSWHPECHQLFSALNPAEWERSGHNPVAVIEKATKARLLIVAHDQSYLRLYKSTMETFDAYMGVSAKDFGALSPERPAAYFSTEYGLSECLPIYSGGLGVLSGDHLKSASDLNIPLVGVGLLYRSGYFRQQIDRDGRQIAQYPENDFATLPLELVKDEGGAPLEVLLQLPGRRLHAQIWMVRVGRVKLYLLDTDTPSNTADDRKITARLYEADRDCRLRQEILLGMGGVQLMRALGIRPSVYHMNEGHSAFLILERIRLLMQERGLSFAEAGELVRGSSLFTTHTPVDAGNERFGLERMEPYFLPYAQSIGLPWPEFVRMGRFEGSERNVFEMTVLALNYSFRANGVSALHGYFSRHMWQEGWKGVPKAEIPIRYVTNGVAHARLLAQKSCKVFLVGGLLRPETEAIIGAAALHSLQQYNFTKAFLGANGVALDAGFTTPDPEEAAVKAAVVRRAREAWFLVDDSKFARIYPAVIAELSGGAILTNHCPNPKYRQFTLVKEATE